LPLYARDFPPVTKPIIFVTAHGARYSDVQLMLFGADKVISKPVNFASLNLALATLQLKK
jgi:DNA-binding response OmpR family regulator